MAELMQFDLVSPERSLMSGQVKAVQIPGADGDLTAMPNHAPTITTLRPGVLVVEGEGDVTKYVVTGGFAQIGDALTVLAERAIPATELDQAGYDALVEQAQAAYTQTKETFTEDKTPVDEAAKTLADTIALAEALGVTPRQASL